MFINNFLISIDNIFVINNSVINCVIMNLKKQSKIIIKNSLVRILICHINIKNNLNLVNCKIIESNKSIYNSYINLGNFSIIIK